jgi:hypothetical protein
VGLAWVATRAPGVAPELIGAAAVVGAWALLGAGALGVRGRVRLRAHRRGILVLAAGLLVLPVAKPQLGLIVPCLLGAAVLFRVGLVRWGALDGEPAATAPSASSGSSGPPPLSPSSAPPAHPASSSVRLAGRWTGRAGTVLGREAASALPRAARAAGRVTGRARQRP